MIGFGMNSMGAHFNPVSLSIVNSESKVALKNAYKATCTGLYLLYKETTICKDLACSFCVHIAEQLSPGNGFREWQAHLASREGLDEYYHLDKPSSDHSPAFHAFAKETFGADVDVQQCGQHLTGACLWNA